MATERPLRTSVQEPPPLDDSFTRHREPKEVFLPLSARRYAQFYSLEMDHFTQDIGFYQKYCRKKSSVLELGCGTGRISRALALHGCHVTGLDYCQEMLSRGALLPGPKTSSVCMDMTNMAFTKKFDHIVIPYNTLNLLQDSGRIDMCLGEAAHLLAPGGTLLVQLHVPDLQLIEAKGQRLFQFQIFQFPERRGTLIKETLRRYLPESQEILLEERYRSRPLPAQHQLENFRQQHRLAAFSPKRWLRFFELNGFDHLSLFGDYHGRPFEGGRDSTLLIKAFRS